MSLDRDLATTGKASAPDLATVPARPQIEPREMTTGGPVVLEHSVGAGWKHALGWEDRPGAGKALEALADRAGAAGRKADLARLAAQTIGILADGRYIPGSGELPD